MITIEVALALVGTMVVIFLVSIPMAMSHILDFKKRAKANQASLIKEISDLRKELNRPPSPSKELSESPSEDTRMTQEDMDKCISTRNKD